MKHTYYNVNNKEIKELVKVCYKEYKNSHFYFYKNKYNYGYKTNLVEELLQKDPQCAEGMFFKYIIYFKENYDKLNDILKMFSYLYNIYSGKLHTEYYADQKINYYLFSPEEILSLLIEESYKMVYDFMSKYIFYVIKKPFYEYSYEKSTLNDFQKRLKRALEETTKALKFLDEKTKIEDIKAKYFSFPKISAISKYYCFIVSIDELYLLKECYGGLINYNKILNKEMKSFLEENDCLKFIKDYKEDYFCISDTDIVKTSDMFETPSFCKKIYNIYYCFFNGIAPPKEKTEKTSSKPEPFKISDDIELKALSFIKDESLKTSLSRLITAKKDLANYFVDKTQLDIFVDLRCDTYIKPYLSKIITNKGILKDNEIIRFTEMFNNVALILEAKKDDIIKEKELLEKIEFEVLENEVTKYIQDNNLKK